MIQKLKTAGRISRYMGVGWIAFRLGYATLRKLGFYQWLCPVRGWRSVPKTAFSDPGKAAIARKPFFFSAEDLPGWREALQALGETAEVLPEAEKISRGVFRFYHWQEVDVGTVPDWFRDPFSGRTADRTRHWSRLKPYPGDIKHVWELSRFSWAFALARAYARDGQAIWPETFWRLFDDWTANNPPQTGANWSCGQECALRLVPWVFALHAFAAHPSTTASRLARMRDAMDATGTRLWKAKAYGLSQRNNHGMSEAMGLLIAGSYGHPHPRASRYQRHGVAQLTELCSDLFYEDGEFCQHSSNYQRLALQILTFSVRLLQVNDWPVPGAMRETLSRASAFLGGLLEPGSGDAPNSGGNDGAHLLPLDASPYTDFRPAVALADAVCGQPAVFAVSPEAGLWMGLSGTAETEGRTEPAVARQQAQACRNYRLFERGRWRAAVKQTRFLCRPAHADLLHADVWYEGERLAVDPGSYSYKAEPPFQHSFRETCHHNVLSGLGRGQMTPVGQFMLLPWVSARCSGSGQSDGFDWAIFEYADNPAPHLPDYQRLVAVGAHCLFVLDRVKTAVAWPFRLHWLLENHPILLTGRSKTSWAGEMALPSTKLHLAIASREPCRFASHNGEPGQAYGWQSRHYNELTPAHSLLSDCTTADNSWLTVFSEWPVVVQSQAGQWQIELAQQMIEIDPAGLVFSVENKP